MASILPAICWKRDEGSKFLHIWIYFLAVKIAFYELTISLKNNSKSAVVLQGIGYL